jgi:hypothetical protein
MKFSHHFIAIITFVSLARLVHAQPQQVSITEVEMKKGESFTQVLERKGGGYYKVSFKAPNSIIEEYDRNLKLVSTKTVPQPEVNGEKAGPDKIYALGNTFIAQIRTRDWKCYIATLRDNKWQDIKQVSLNLKDNLNWYYIQSAYSPDSSNLLLYNGYPPASLVVVNADKGITLEKKLANPAGVIQALVSNDNNVYFLHEAYVKDEPTRFYIRHVSSKAVDSLDLKFNNAKLIVGPSIALDEEGNIVCAGLYRNDNESSIEGTFMGTYYPEENTLEDMKLETLDETMQSVLTAEMPEMKKIFYAPFSQYIELALFKYGQNWIYAVQQECRNSKEIRSDYNPGEIIVVNFSDDGNVNWVSRIPKAPWKLTFADVVRGGDNVYFIYNEEVGNITRTSLPEMKIVGASKTGIAIASVNLKSGATERKVLAPPGNKLQDLAKGTWTASRISDDYLSIFYLEAKRAAQGIFKVN